MAQEPLFVLLCDDPALREIISQHLRQSVACELLMPQTPQDQETALAHAQLAILDREAALSDNALSLLKNDSIPILQLGMPALADLPPAAAIEKPIRLQSLGEQIQKLLNRSQRPAEIAFGPCLFQPQERLLSGPLSSEPAHLTEKEAAILLCLHTGPTAREALLQTVWGHKQPLSTHTLETHLYRLRRKIEAICGDRLQILGEEGGYRLTAS